MLMVSDNLWNEIEEILITKKNGVGRPAHDAKLTTQWHSIYHANGCAVAQFTGFLW